MHATTIYEKGVEFFVAPDGELYFHEKGQSKPFTEITIDIATAIRADMENHPEAIKALESWGITEPMDQIKQYVYCRFGGTNITPDLVDGNVLNKEEYWECGKRTTCPYEGKVCAHITCGQNIISHSELMVGRLIAKSYRNSEIAWELGKSIETIKMQIKSFLQKIDGRSRVDIVNFLHHKNL